MARPERSTERSARICRRSAARRRSADGVQDRIDDVVAPPVAAGTPREPHSVRGP